MTSALKMAAPGELCSQIKKLMVFCKDTARSIKAMRQYLAVTQAVMDDLLNQALSQKLLWRQSNGMYKTTNTKFALIEADLPTNDTAAGAADNSLLALADQPTLDDGQPGSVLDAAWSALCEAADAKTEAAQANTLEQVEQMQQADTVDIDAEIDALVKQGLVQPEGDTLQVNEPASTKALLDAELTALAESLAPEQFPVIDDIDSKQHALTGIAVLLKQRTPALASLAEQLATDLSVIRLHQERRA